MACYWVTNNRELEKAWAELKAGDCILIVVDDKKDFRYTFQHFVDSSREDWSGVCC